MNALSGNWYRVFPILALAVLAAATFWLERASRVAPEPPPGSARHDPDLTVERFTLQRYNLSGTRQYQLSGALLTHYPDDDSSLLTQPKMVFDGDGRPLHLEADTGKIISGGERVHLSGNVRAQRQGDSQHPSMIFESAALTLWPDTEQAESRSPIRLTQGATVIHANSMAADNLFGHLSFSGKVTALLTRRSPSQDQPSLSAP